MREICFRGLIACRIPPLGHLNCTKIGKVTIRGRIAHHGILVPMCVHVLAETWKWETDHSGSYLLKIFLEKLAILNQARLREWSTFRKKGICASNDSNRGRNISPVVMSLMTGRNDARWFSLYDLVELLTAHGAST